MRLYKTTFAVVAALLYALLAAGCVHDLREDLRMESRRQIDALEKYTQPVLDEAGRITQVRLEEWAREHQPYDRDEFARIVLETMRQVLRDMADERTRDDGARLVAKMIADGMDRAESDGGQ